MCNQKKLIAWFLTFAGLTAVAQFPFVVLIGTIFTFGVLSILMIPAPTILLYSITLLPVLMVDARLSKPSRYGAASALVALVAFLPGQLSRNAAEAPWRQISRDDFTSHVAAQPKTIEIADDTASRVCTELCLRLLFNREVERVRIGSPAQRGVAYHIERRESCPDPVFRVEKVIRDRLVAGECLIRIAGTNEPGDAVIRLTRLPGTTRKLSIEQRQPDGTTAQIWRQTELETQIIAQPFFFGYAFPDIESGMGYAGITIARQTFSINPIDLTQALRSVFAFRAIPVEGMPTEDVKEVAKRILARAVETSPTFSRQQQGVLSEAMTALGAQEKLGDADIDLVSRMIRDTRVDHDEMEGSSPIESLFQKHAAQLGTTIPLVLSRLGSPETPRRGGFQWALDRALMHFPAESLRPNSNAIIELVETRPGGPTDGLLSRAAEVDGDASGVIAKYLDGDSLDKRQDAGVAICRATLANWKKLEPIALAHLDSTARIGWPTSIENHGLLLALVRFGEKDAALKAIETASIRNEDPIPDAHGQRQKEAFKRELESLERDFSPDRCHLYR